MMRLIGILTGSALAVTILVVAFGVPELTATDDAPVAIPPAVTVPTDAAPAVVEAAPIDLPSEADAVDPAAALDTMDPAADTNPSTEPEALVDNYEEPVVTPAPVPAPAEPTQHWYAFWSPFRSELAANGFISELQRTTGLDYRVVKLKPGVYEVAFAYADPNDRQDKLEQISAATGLDMSGG